jgi:preflagellin peptidase FlaK
MLVLASYLDIKSREVQDKFWIPFAALGTILTAYDFYVGSPGFNLIELALAIGFTSVFAWGAYFLHLYGGADAKAISTLSVIFPIYETSSFHRLGALTTLTNSVLLTALLPIALVALNLVKLSRGEKIFQGFEEEGRFAKIQAMFLGLRKKEAGKYDFPLENSAEGRRRFDFSLGKIDEDFATGEDVWVTPGIPLLVFVFLGFIVTLGYGDVLFAIMSFFFRLFL